MSITITKCDSSTDTPSSQLYIRLGSLTKQLVETAVLVNDAHLKQLTDSVAAGYRFLIDVGGKILMRLVDLYAFCMSHSFARNVSDGICLFELTLLAYREWLPPYDMRHEDWARPSRRGVSM